MSFVVLTVVVVVMIVWLAVALLASGCAPRLPEERVGRGNKPLAKPSRSQTSKPQKWDPKKLDVQPLEDSPHSREEEPDPAGVIAFSQLAADYKRQVEEFFPTIQAETDDSSCPPSRIKLTGIKNEVRIDTKNIFAKGSGSRLFLSVPDEKFMVKFISRKKKISALLNLADDYAFLKIFQKSTQHVVPSLFEIEPGSMPEACRVRLLVTEFAGSNIIKDLNEERDSDKKRRIVAAVGARALELLREVHKQGLIHGDIHYKNFVYSGDRVDAARTLRLIDFGRAAPFILPDGSHVPEEEINYSENRDWNEIHLSPWELRNIRKTRRDDIYRLAETLLRSGGYDSLFQEKYQKLKYQEKKHGPKFKSQVLEMKESRRFVHSVPKIFIDFYTESSLLGYESRPDYESWIEKFRNVAKGMSYQ